MIDFVSCLVVLVFYFCLWLYISQENGCEDYL